MSNVVIEYAPCVPTDSHPSGMALWWLAINIGTDKEAYTSFNCKPTKRQIRQFQKSSKSSAIKGFNVKDSDMEQEELQEEPVIQIGS
ncbi:TPA: DUF7279 family protein [Vibrio parahaemolyticus]|uniref:DUF7279 family protein n=1 Tax=Vibrio parahaemolyticus TaxID=670 RepID=UPI003D10DC8A